MVRPWPSSLNVPDDKCWMLSVGIINNYLFFIRDKRSFFCWNIYVYSNYFANIDWPRNGDMCTHTHTHIYKVCCLSQNMHVGPVKYRNITEYQANHWSAFVLIVPANSNKQQCYIYWNLVFILYVIYSVYLCCQIILFLFCSYFTHP